MAGGLRAWISADCMRLGLNNSVSGKYNVFRK